MNPPQPPIRTTIELRVRYAECDPMGVAHHSAYPVWFEMARTELLRQAGSVYAQLEADGLFIVVARLAVNYHRPARYDDVLKVTAALRRSSAAKIEHDYEIHRGAERLCTGSTVLACVDGAGRVQPVPEALRVAQA